MIAIQAGRIFDGHDEFEGAVIVLDAGRILDITDTAPAGAELVVLDDSFIVSPGFIDLQVNGGGGVMFNDRTDVAGLAAITEAHARAGTTSLLATLISSERPRMALAMAAVRQGIAAALPGLLGLHLEGPFLAPTRRGIHPLAAITEITPEDVAMLSAGFPAPLLVTLAPDAVAPAHVATLAQAGVVVFAGHSDAGFEQVRAALAAGLRGFTHLYNAMSPFAGRAPGMVGTALDDARAFAGIIADGHHAHPAALRIALGCMGPDRLFLVSDAMATAASDCTGFTLAGVDITLADGRLTDAAGTLAGAHLTMAEAVRNLVRLAGADWTTALRMATATPASCLGLADRGRIKPGMHADLVVLDEDLVVRQVWQGGRRLPDLVAA